MKEYNINVVISSVMKLAASFATMGTDSTARFGHCISPYESNAGPMLLL